MKQRVWWLLHQHSTYILRVGTKGFDIDSLNLIVVGPDDFAAAVH